MPTFFITPEKGIKHQVLAGVGASEFRKFRRLRILGLGASAGGVLSSGWCVCVCAFAVLAVADRLQSLCRAVEEL